VVALKSNAAAEKSKDQLSRDFQGCSIFDFCNNIRQKRAFKVLLIHTGIRPPWQYPGSVVRKTGEANYGANIGYRPSTNRVGPRS
jgi:hypothetical protein